MEFISGKATFADRCQQFLILEKALQGTDSGGLERCVGAGYIKGNANTPGSLNLIVDGASVLHSARSQ